MLKIPNISQIREWDQVTIARQGISSLDLMERAARVFTDIFIEFNPLCKVVAVCGKGNNGGDGLAILRLLSEQGYSCSGIILEGGEKESPDFKTNLLRGQSIFTIIRLNESSALNLGDADVIIDAIFGSGLSRRPDGIFAEVIEKLNHSGKKIVSVDIPSGLIADGPSPGEVVQASETITFQAPKLGFFMPEGINATGILRVAAISLDKEYEHSLESFNFFIEKRDLTGWIKPRLLNSHKGNYGHALIMAGSYGMMGAAVLSVKAAMRAGSGKVTASVPSCGYEIMQISVPEAMVCADKNSTHLSALPDLDKFNVIAFGPGTGTTAEVHQLLAKLLTSSTVPLVIDADGLNMLAVHTEMLHLLSRRVILTPHPGEFARLVGVWKNDFERYELQRKFSKKTGAVVILKGARTSIALPSGEVYFNPTGNPYMATAGSGDVLTGIITALLAQGFEPAGAACTGVYLHGLAGDLVSQKAIPIVAGDLISGIPNAWKHILTPF